MVRNVDSANISVNPRDNIMRWLSSAYKSPALINHCTPRVCRLFRWVMNKSMMNGWNLYSILCELGRQKRKIQFDLHFQICIENSAYKFLK